MLRAASQGDIVDVNNGRAVLCFQNQITWCLHKLAVPVHHPPLKRHMQLLLSVRLAHAEGLAQPRVP